MALLKEPAGQRRGHQHADVHRAGGLAEDGDVVGVAAEAGDVVVNPAEGEDLIHEAVVARGVMRRFADEFGMREEAEDAEAVVEGDDEHAVVEQRALGVETARTGAAEVGAAVDPEHDGEQASGWPCGGDDVEKEAVFLAGALRRGGSSHPERAVCRKRRRRWRRECRTTSFWGLARASATCPPAARRRECREIGLRRSCGRSAHVARGGADDVGIVRGVDIKSVCEEDHCRQCQSGPGQGTVTYAGDRSRMKHLASFERNDDREFYQGRITRRVCRKLEPRATTQRA